MSNIQQRPNLVRSVGIGSAFAIGWTPCVGPVLAAILGLASTQSSALQAAVLLGFYAVGFSVPFLLFGLFFAQARRLFRLIAPHLETISVVSGALVIVMGILIFTDSLINLNAAFSFARVDENVGGPVSLGVAGLSLAFVAGTISVISPCVLPMVPVYLLYLTGSSINDTGDLAEGNSTAFLHSIAFVSGFSIVFVVLGVLAGIAGSLVPAEVLSKAAGLLLIVLGLQLSGVINIPLLQTQRGVANV